MSQTVLDFLDILAALEADPDWIEELWKLCLPSNFSPTFRQISLVSWTRHLGGRIPSGAIADRIFVRSGHYPDVTNATVGAEAIGVAVKREAGRLPMQVIILAAIALLQLLALLVGKVINHVPNEVQP